MSRYMYSLEMKQALSDTFEIHQDTLEIHVSFRIHSGYTQDTSGYVSDRKLYPNTIGN
jgi:hypothetical protein